MKIVLGQFEFHPDDFQAAKLLAATLMQETVKEHGCMKYAFAPHILAYQEGLKALRVISRVVKRYEVSSSR
jgi:hypothetical protein